jgi:hypothetical protein
MSPKIDAEELKSGSAISQRDQTERAHADDRAGGLRSMPCAKERALLQVERPAMRRHVTRTPEQRLAVDKYCEPHPIWCRHKSRNARRDIGGVEESGDIRAWPGNVDMLAANRWHASHAEESVPYRETRLNPALA